MGLSENKKAPANANVSPSVSVLVELGVLADKDVLFKLGLRAILGVLLGVVG